jgi:hypothetical protein
LATSPYKNVAAFLFVDGDLTTKLNPAMIAGMSKHAEFAMKAGRPKSLVTKGKRCVIAIDESLVTSIKKEAVKYHMSMSDYARRLMRIGMEVVEKDPLRLLK